MAMIVAKSPSLIRKHALWVLVCGTIMSTTNALFVMHQPFVLHQSMVKGSSSPSTTTTARTPTLLSRNLHLKATDADNDQPQSENEGAIDLSLDERLYRVRLSRATGIEWGTDLSFAFVYVRGMDPSGDAAISGEVNIGDQLCEVTPVVVAEGGAAPTAINLLGAPFDYVMNTFASLDKNVKDIDLVFFRGTKQDLKAVCSGDGASGKEPETITITVIQNKGSPQEAVRKVVAPVGCNVREVLIDAGINVYQSVTRWTNCKGKQLCGTCIVNVTDGSVNTNRKSMDEESTLRENPESYRLSCVTFAYGDVTIETFPPINAAQWTR